MTALAFWGGVVLGFSVGAFSIAWVTCALIGPSWSVRRNARGDFEKYKPSGNVETWREQHHKAALLESQRSGAFYRRQP